MDRTRPVGSKSELKSALPAADLFPALARRLTKKSFDRASTPGLSGSKWTSLRGELVELVLNSPTSNLAESLPGISGCTDCVVDSDAWVPVGVDPLRRRTKNVLLSNLSGGSSPPVLSDLGRYSPAAILEWRNAGLTTLEDLVTVLVEVLIRRSLPKNGDLGSGQGEGGLSGVASGEPGQRRTSSEHGESVLSIRGDDLRLVGRWLSASGSGSSLGEALALEGADSNAIPDNVAKAIRSIRELDLVEAAGGQPSAAALLEALRLKLGDREWRVFEQRNLSTERPTLEKVGKELGVTRERARQIEADAKRSIREALKATEFEPLGWIATAFAARLGVAVRSDSRLLKTSASLVLGKRWKPVDLEMLLWLAGPYSRQEGWLVTTPLSDLEATMLDLADADGIFQESPCDLLAGLGVSQAEAEGALSVMPHVARRLGRDVRWNGTVLDKALCVLSIAGKPLAGAEIARIIDEGYNVSSLKDRMRCDSRFVRSGRDSYGLAVWGLDEYSGIVDEIEERLRAAGEPLVIDDLARSIAADHGVSAGSVRSYCSVPRFFASGGLVRLRLGSDPLPSVGELATAKGVFLGPGELIVVTPVDGELLRGSGRQVAATVAEHLGVRPGSSRTFLAESSSVTLRWSDASWTPALSSLRAFAGGCSPDSDHLMRIAFSLEGDSAHPSVFRGEDPSLGLLSSIAGIEVATIQDAELWLSGALGVSPRQVRATLRARGDEWLVGALASQSQDSDIREALARFEAEVGAPGA
jgi:hypothetical protein